MGQCGHKSRSIIRQAFGADPEIWLCPAIHTGRRAATKGGLAVPQYNTNASTSGTSSSAASSAPPPVTPAQVYAAELPRLAAARESGDVDLAARIATDMLLVTSRPGHFLTVGSGSQHVVIQRSCAKLAL